MLPDFPRQKSSVSAAVMDWVSYAAQRRGMLSTIARHTHHEGSIWTIDSENGGLHDSPYTLAQATTLFEHSEIPDLTPKAFLSKIESLVAQLIAGQEKHLVDRISTAAQQAGNIIDNQGQPFSPDLLLQALERIDFSFSPDGKPNVAALLPPQVHQRVAEKLAAWNDDPTLQRQWENLLDRKRKAWNDREADRKLVD